MSKNRVIKSISFEPSVFQALEELRGGKQHFTSEFVNEVLKEKLNIKGDKSEN